MISAMSWLGAGTKARLSLLVVLALAARGEAQTVSGELRGRVLEALDQVQKGTLTRS